MCISVSQKCSLHPRRLCLGWWLHGTSKIQVSPIVLLHHSQHVAFILKVSRGLLGLQPSCPVSRLKERNEGMVRKRNVKVRVYQKAQIDFHYSSLATSTRGWEMQLLTWWSWNSDSARLAPESVLQVPHCTAFQKQWCRMRILFLLYFHYM